MHKWVVPRILGLDIEIDFEINNSVDRVALFLGIAIGTCARTRDRNLIACFRA